MHFSQLFSSIAYFKVCFEVRKIRLPFFSCRSLLLSTSVLNDYWLQCNRIVMNWRHMNCNDFWSTDSLPVGSTTKNWLILLSTLYALVCMCVYMCILLIYMGMHVWACVWCHLSLHRAQVCYQKSKWYS